MPLSVYLRSLPGRFAPRQLLRRPFWPLLLGLALGFGAVMMTWTATTTYESLRYCYDYEYSCYGTTWSSSSWGGFGAGEWTLPLLLGLTAVAAWAAARRDRPRPSWFDRVPAIAMAVLVGVALLGLPDAVALSDWFGEEPMSGLIQTYDPAGGPFLMLLATWPLWLGVRRVRQTLDTPSTAPALSVRPAQSAAPAGTTAG